MRGELLVLMLSQTILEHLAKDLTSEGHATLVVDDHFHLIAGTCATPFSWLLVTSSTLHQFLGTQQSKFAAYPLVRIRQS